MSMTAQHYDLTQQLGLSMSALFGLILGATVLVFGPFVAMQIPAPGSTVIWVVTGAMEFFAAWLVFRAGGTRCLVASMRKQPRFWVFAAANFGIGIAFVLSTFNALDLLVSN